MRINKKLKKQFTEMSQKHPDCLFFMGIGDHYITFGDVCDKVSKILDVPVTRTMAKDFTAKQVILPSAWSRMNVYVDKLQKHFSRIALCDQLQK